MNELGTPSKITSPFDAYDFLGYITPGATLLISIFIFEQATPGVRDTKPHFVPLTGAIEVFIEYLESIEAAPAGVSIINYLFFAIILIGSAYVTGHIISAISSLFIHRIMLEGILGAPYKVLLRIEVPKLPPFKKFFSAIFFWGNTYLVVRFVDHFFVEPVIFEKIAPRFLALVMASLILFYVLHVVANLMKKLPLMEKVKNFSEGSIEFLSLPHDWIIDQISVKPLNTTILNKCKKAFQDRYEIDIEKAGSHAPWLSYIHVRRESESLDEMAGNLLRQYAFSRNISTGFYIAFFYCFGWLIAHDIKPLAAGVVWEGNPITYLFSIVFRSDLMLFMPLLYFFAAILMLTRYYYLYGHYHAQFIFRSFVELDS